MKDPVEIMRRLNKSLQLRNQMIHNRLLGLDSSSPQTRSEEEKPPSGDQDATPVDDFSLPFFLIDEEAPPEIEQAYVNQTIDLGGEASQPAAKVRKRGMPKPNEEQIAAATERIEALKSYFAQLKPKPAGYMLCFVMYDVEDDRIRKKIADYLIEKGLQRVQKSVFLGQLSQKTYDEIYRTMHALQATYENQDSIMIVPIAEQELRSMRLIGRDIDVEITLGRAHTLFF